MAEEPQRSATWEPESETDSILDEGGPSGIIAISPAAINFSKFGEFPRELQLQIWKYAASPHRFLRLDENFIEAAVPRFRNSVRIGLKISTHKRHLCHFLSHLSIKAADELADGRQTLMAACLASRQVVLETWRDEISAVEVTDSGRQWGLSAPNAPNNMAQRQKMKLKLIAYLGKAIL